MSMKNKEAEELLLKYKAGTATAEEKALVETWYARFKDRVSTVSGNQVLADQAESWAIFEREYANGAKVTKLWPRIAIAAAAVAAITLGMWLYYTPRHPDAGQDPGSAQYVNDIAPGKNGATVTLANGKVIQLSDAKTGVVIGDGRIVYSSPDDIGTHDEVASIPRNDVMQMTASTARGQTYQFTLPDGTKVWLNADSKISFPSQFTGKERKIMLEGEAYFEVVHNAKQPFRVESKGQIVEDIGTEFNINAYADEGSTKTTLIEGSAAVNKLVLKPNQQSVLTNNNQIKVTEVDSDLAVAWKNNEFMFASESIETVMKMVERWYNVEVVYVGKKTTERFSGGVSRFDNVSKVLQIVESTGAVHFKIEGRKIYVSP
jgi:transmembrane sensor